MEAEIVRDSEKEARAKSLIEIIAPILWIFFIINNFIFDIFEFFIAKCAPTYHWIITWKILPVAVLVLLVILFIKLKSLLFVLFYPFIIFFWRLPRLLFKRNSWNVAIAIVKSIFAFFKSFKYWIILTCLYIIATIMLMKTVNQIIVFICISVMVVLTIAEQVRNIIIIFRAPKSSKLLEKLGDIACLYAEKNCIPEQDIQSIQFCSLTEDQQKNWIENLRTTVIANRGCLFIAKKLSDYKKSNFEYMSRVLTMLFLGVFIIITFAFINHGLYMTDASLYYYKGSLPVTWYDFFYYSFSIVASQPSNIEATKLFSQIFVIIEKSEMFFLLAILMGNLVSVWKENNTVQLKFVISNLEGSGQKLEEFIKDNYAMDSVQGAIDKLKELKSDALDFIFYLSERL